MKLHFMEFLFGKNYTLHKTSKLVLLITFSLTVLATIPLFYPSLGYPIFLLRNYSQSSPSNDMKDGIQEEPINHIPKRENCDIFTSGEWVPNPGAPYYTNTTCWAIHEHQNCMKYGRPDTDFIKWRWKPDGCELPIFNPAQFFEIVRGKSMAFVGDSLARNQMQSLICLLSRVVYPVDASYTTDENFKRWSYTNYNFTLATFWTPHLITSKEADANDPTHTGLFNLYLDEFNQDWTNQIEEFNYVIISVGHWFFRPTIFYENHKIVGCNYCLLYNVTDLTMFYGYRKAFRTAFRAINSLENYYGVTFLRTFAPKHFENGKWNEGGNCLRTRPFRSNETTLNGTDLELYMVQLEEFKVAEREGKKKGLKFRLLDITPATILRPDGHPCRYGHWPQENVTLYNDCVHWCLPGPIDTWNYFLLEMLKMEGVRLADEKIHSSIDRKQRI
ncbi:PC-Esterase domain-containing protein/PMR5N domain-containing protein [Cephalotus follicularis]|uniref:PC-Esterase domain-containing protein/PMR5N domain-containing protein n=1 Tax=Cephalotus follicularis TaxID=3775 RepID=A0A1Q3AWG8_CEPFO|nr:PC-Esterase domain-containing protein/PMR5N domain-containing protein [Cephalotus follicularis]